MTREIERVRDTLERLSRNPALDILEVGDVKTAIRAIETHMTSTQVMRDSNRPAMEKALAALESASKIMDSEAQVRQDAAIAALRAALAEPEGWRPIETAPKDGTDILLMYVHIDTQIVHAGFWLEDEENPGDTGWWTYEWSEVSRTMLDDWRTPTHWMPLPAAAKEKA